MGVITYEYEVHSSIRPERLFKSFVLDGDNLLPKVLPDAIKSIQTVEGDGGVGSVKVINYGKGRGHKTAKHRIDEMDESHKIYKYTSLDDLSVNGKEGVEKITNTVKIDFGPDDGSILKIKTECHVQEHHNVTDEKIKEVKEKARGLFKAVEEYLHAHPHEYTT